MTNSRLQIRVAFPRPSPESATQAISPITSALRFFSPAKYVICYLLSVISFEPKARMNFRYAHGEISDGFISERPPQNTLVYVTGIPHWLRWWSIAVL